MNNSRNEFVLEAQASPKLFGYHECEIMKTRTSEIEKFLKKVDNPADYHPVVILLHNNTRWILCLGSSYLPVKFCPYCGLNLEKEITKDDSVSQGDSDE